MVESYVSRRLLIACLLIVGCAGFSFGLGSMEGVPGATGVAEAAEVSEVKDSNFVPRRNPAAGRASSAVYAAPAVPLRPEVERLPTPVYAISGVRNQEIQEGSRGEVVDIVIELPARETFSRGLVEGTDVSDWILNLPSGLEGSAHNVRKGATSIRIYVAGTPTVTAREEIKVRIPGTVLVGGTDLQFVSPTETESISAWEASQTAEQPQPQQ
jgi:hypothetical protein